MIATSLISNIYKSQQNKSKDPFGSILKKEVTGFCMSTVSNIKSRK